MASQQNNKTKSFCKVCFDAGKSESEYTSHFVRSEPGPRGKVVCPTLLSQACTYCHINGHTVKFCPTLKKRNKIENRKQKQNEYYSCKEYKKPVQKENKKSVFAILDSDSDDDVEPEKEDNFPMLSRVTEKKELNCATSYASMAARVPILKPCEDNTSTIAVMGDTQSQEELTPDLLYQSVGVIVPNKLKYRSWADWSDSEDEDEDEDW